MIWKWISDTGFAINLLFVVVTAHFVMQQRFCCVRSNCNISLKSINKKVTEPPVEEQGISSESVSNIFSLNTMKSSLEGFYFTNDLTSIHFGFQVARLGNCFGGDVVRKTNTIEGAFI